MRKTTVKKNLASYEVVDTKSLDRTDFNTISHQITCNKHDINMSAKFGGYTVNFDFSHDEHQVKRVSKKNKDYFVSGGIDKGLTSICNLYPKTMGLQYMRRSLINKGNDTSSVVNITTFFKTEIDKLKVNRKRPDFYTGTIKHTKARHTLADSALMLVELDDSLKIFVVMGSVKYSFFVEKHQNLSALQKNRTNRYASFTANSRDCNLVDWYEAEEDMFDLIDTPELKEPILIKPNRTKVSSQLCIKHNIQTKRSEPDELDELLEGLVL